MKIPRDGTHPVVYWAIGLAIAIGFIILIFNKAVFLEPF